MLVRIPRGPRPSLHRLRGGLLRFVRRLPSYYGEVRLLGSVHHRANRLDGRPALQILEHSDPDSNPIRKIVREFVHVHETREELLAAEEPVLIEDTARTKR